MLPMIVKIFLSFEKLCMFCKVCLDKGNHRLLGNKGHYIKAVDGEVDAS